jgi:adenosylcobinamide-GDP ribazoletransferase
MSGLRAAAAFLTRVPVGRGQTDEATLARSVPWFPVVGGLVGLAVAGLYSAGAWVLPTLVSASLAVVGGVVLTGAFHEDGLADCADAVGGWTPEQARRILRDPVHGTYGVLALLASVLIRVAALAALSPGQAVAALPAAHALGRGAALWALLRHPPAAGDGLGASYAARASSGAVGAGVAASLVIAAAAGWVAAFALVCAGGALGMGRWARTRLGGLTGDVLGAIEQIGEVIVLVGAAAFAQAGIRAAPWLP